MFSNKVNLLAISSHFKISNLKVRLGGIQIGQYNERRDEIQA